MQALISIGGAVGMGVGLVHIGFALTDPAPRCVWDWYVVAMGFGLLALAIPAARHYS